MFKLVILIVTLFVIFLGNGECGAYGRTTGNRYDEKNAGMSYNNNGGRFNGQKPTASSPNYRLQSAGMSAWGIITLILFVIIFGMIVYYGFMCIPLICDAQKDSYSIMERESGTTGSPSPSDYSKQAEYSSRSPTPTKHRSQSCNVMEVDYSVTKDHSSIPYADDDIKADIATNNYNSGASVKTHYGKEFGQPILGPLTSDNKPNMTMCCTHIVH